MHRPTIGPGYDVVDLRGVVGAAGRLDLAQPEVTVEHGQAQRTVGPGP